MDELQKIEKIVDIETDAKSVLLDHILENETEHLDLQEQIESTSEDLKRIEQDTELQFEAVHTLIEDIQLTPGEKGDRGEKGEPGKEGEKGEPGQQGKQGEPGKDGLNGIDGLDGQDGQPGKDGSPDLPKDIKTKLESLRGKERLDASAIQNLPQPIINNIREVTEVRNGGLELIKSNGSIVKQGASQIDFGDNLTVTPTLNGVRVNSIDTSGGQVDSVIAGNGVIVDSTDPINPIVSIKSIPETPVLVGGIQDNTNFSQSYSVYISGNYAYLASLASNALSIIDITVPSSPVRISTLQDNTNLDGCRNVFVAGNFAYVANQDDNSMRIIDISNPSSPVIVGGVKDNTNLLRCYFVNVAGQYAYVINNSDNSMRIIDVSDPTAPFIVGGVKDNTNLSGAYGMNVNGRYAYVSCGTDNSLRIIDVSDPTSPTIVGGVKDNSLLSAARAVYVSGRYAYVTAFTGNTVSVIDVSNPTSPSIVGSVTDSSNLAGVRSVQVQGKYAYVGAASDSSIRVIDVSDPTSPSIVAGIKDTSNIVTPHGIFISGENLYIANNSTILPQFSVLKLTGFNLTTANIGALKTGTINVQDDIVGNKNAYIQSGLNVGEGGVATSGTVSGQNLVDSSLTDSAIIVSETGLLTSRGVTIDSSNNLYVPATQGSEQAPALTTGNWTLGTGWAYGTSPDRLLKNADGTGTATPSATTTIVSGTTYKVTIVVSTWTVGSATFSLGGITSSTSLTSATTYTAYITANTTGKLIITPTNTSRFEISSISIIPFVADTGETIIDGTLDVRSTATFHNQLLVRGTANLSAPSIAFSGATSTGLIAPGQGVANTFSMVSNAVEIMWFTGSRLRGLSNTFTWDIQGIWLMQANATLGMHHQTTALSGGARRSDTFTMAANTNQTASTEISSITFNLSATRQWATGAITTQRELLIQAPTYSFVGASTITNASTVAITGSPTAGTNATITNAYSFWVQAGTTKLDGLLDLSGIAAGSPNMRITATTDTPTTTWTAGVPSTDPAGFMEITVGGNARYIPFWT